MTNLRPNDRKSLEAPSGQRILITGGTGFIGTALTQRLCGDNKIVLLDRELSGSAYQVNGMDGHRNIQIEVGDILDQKTVERVVKDVDIVIHLAAIVGVNKVCAHALDTIETNLLGTFILMRSLEKVNGLKRVLFFSTSEVYGINSFRATETSPSSVGPAQEARWSYAISKLAGEHLVQSYYRERGIPSVTIRPFNVFGPGRIGDHAMLRFIWSALRGEDLVVHGSGDQIRSWCYIDDLVRGVVTALVIPEAVGEDFNIGNARNTTTIYDLAKRIVTLTNSKSTIRFEQPNYSDIDIRVPRLDKARKVLAFEPRVELDDGIRRTVAWCLEHKDDVAVALRRAPSQACTEQRAGPILSGVRLGVGPSY